MNDELIPPAPFLEIRVHCLDGLFGCTGLCAGYENGDWRTEAFAHHVMHWLPEFALTWSELKSLSSANAMELITNAAKVVYNTDKYSKRGEFGELLLHVAIRQVFGSLPAISKVYFKSASNDTVKGFDAVHVVGPPDKMELWLGEAKFYQNAKAAIADALQSIQEHTNTDYLRNEFLLISNKIDTRWPHADILKSLLSGSTSLDKIFVSACFPALVTYDSEAVRQFAAVTDQYKQEFEREVLGHYAEFRDSAQELGLAKLKLHVFLLPLKSKIELVAALHRRLEHLQGV